jgi:CRISP-associated protein Cas1
VTAKLHNAAALAVRFRFKDAAIAAADIRGIMRNAAQAEGVATLLGHEGSGAARYFEALAASVDPAWGFSGREKRPALDPINSMLSFGYSMLYNHVSTALVAAGLNPRLGLYHRGHGSHHALASDLMEPLRFLVDAVVWAVVQKRRVAPADFTLAADGTGETLMTSDCRRMFIGEVDRRLLTTFTPSTGHSETYRAFIDRQARQFARFVTGAAKKYEAYRLHA